MKTTASPFRYIQLFSAAILVGVVFLFLPALTFAANSGQCCYCTANFADSGTPIETIHDPGVSSGDQSVADCSAFESETENIITTCELKQEACPSSSTVRPITPPDPAVDIPGLDELSQELELDKTKTFYQVPWIAEYISAIYKFGVGVAMVLAVAMVVFGGFVWMTAGGNANQVTTAKGYILGAIGGVVLAMGSYSILYLVNPNLTKLSGVLVPYIENIPLEVGPRISAYLEANPGEKGKKDQFNNAECPTKEEAQIGFEGFITSYYSPGYGEKGGFDTFECNVAMNCSCPGPGGNKSHKDESKKCNFPAHVLSTGFSDNPCMPIPVGSVPGKDYCNESAKGTPPVAYKTAAGDIPGGSGKDCWSKGDQFVIEGIGGQAAGTWTIEDSGNDIQSRHFDLFVGTDFQATKKVGGVYKIKFTKCQKCGF